ncbi:MAG: hypothetical protein JNK61_04455 [Bacteroidia bacterium]|nr:hypothetical protein [Bacteroidia bacterium]
MDKDDIENEAPLLFGLKKQTPYQVPDGYFNTLPDNIQKAVSNQQKQTRIISIKRITVSTSIAAAIIASVLWFNKPATENLAPITVNEILASSIISDLDVEELALLTENTNTSSETVAIENYLIENNIPEDELINALN